MPGQRTFYLQARAGVDLIALKLEKQQVAALSQLLGELLSDLPAPGPLPDPTPLEEPVEAVWAVGTMQLAYDADADRVVLVAEELRLDDDDGGDEAEGDGPDHGSLLLTRAQAAGLIAQAEVLVTAGRPPCPLCGHPLDPAGHSCPKTNGHGPPSR